MKLVAVVLGLILLIPAGGGAETAPSPAGSTSCLPAGSEAPLFEVKSNSRKHLLPLKLRLLGFSRAGRIALLEQREGEETTGALWFLRVVDLGSDRVIAEQEFDTAAGTTTALCKAHGTKISRILTANQVEPSPLPGLTPFPLEADGDKISVDVRAGRKDGSGTRRHEVWLKSRQGGKRLGVVREVDVESGANALGPPATLGALRSPWESRIAVLIRQDEVGIEAAVVPLVRVLGARLDSRWQPRQ